VQDTKDRGQQAIIGTPERIEPPRPAGGQAVDPSRLQWRHVPLIAAVGWAIILLLDGAVHAMFLPFSDEHDEPWSWPRAIQKSGLKMAIFLAIGMWVSWRRRK
jgi:hypothetical protein